MDWDWDWDWDWKCKGRFSESVATGDGGTYGQDERPFCAQVTGKHHVNPTPSANLRAENRNLRADWRDD
ncbi:hypothetical protein [Geomicrobium sp. JCM 19039]|uniref:hypothetical protein n=1 Tax=Geomicrobium sp. JCM 19039 TaxID=1460636 RepID=UPI0005A92E2A|nr:hypothetical protein [Geomicrobium sp. JCM 19039]